MKTDQKDKNLKEELKNTRENNRFLVKELEKHKNREQENNYLNQVRRLNNHGKRNISLKSNKQETKLCEICSQIKQDKFKYSRVSAKGFNTYHVYRICSFCQKVVQLVI